MPEAIFTELGEGRFRANELAAGPWDPAAQHGGAPAALVARAFELHGDAAGMSFARLSYELLRPVPVGEISVSTAVLRPGRRVRLLAASIEAGGTEVCRASALLIRREQGVVSAAGLERQPAPALPGADAARAFSPPHGAPTFAQANEIRFAAGAFDELGPATAWFRLSVPLVEGEATSPLQRVAAAADFGTGISTSLSWAEYLFINPDLTIYLDRQPQGEWVCLASQTFAVDTGSGVGESVLYDEHGRIGRAAQGLYIERRAATVTSA